MVRRIIKILEQLDGAIFTIIIYLMGWISIPTISSIEELQPKVGFIKWLFNLYSKNSIVYIIVTLIISTIITYIIFKMIKYRYKKIYENSYSKKEIQNQYSEFLDDADFVWIFGGKLSFLNQSDSQFKKIKSLGSKCKIICEDFTDKSEKSKEKYNELIKNNVQIRSYSKEITNNLKNFRGQIKTNNDGVMESLFVSKEKDNKNKEVFKKINLPNQYLNEMLHKNFELIFEEGRNPMIKCIVFDLGGVYFDGDFSSDFLKPVNEMLSQHIPLEREQKLLLDRRLNLGEIDIVKYIENKINRNLNDNERKFIWNQWKNVWRPNKNMKSLVENLKISGYTVTVMSNLDKENGDMYIDRGDFDIFDDNLFLSYQYNILKPDKLFFEKIYEKYNIRPYEILFIDDHEENIKVAKDLGMNTIRFCINSDPNLDVLYRELKNVNIKVNNQLSSVCNG